MREEVLGDLVEHWNLRVNEQHWLARVAWAWRQPLSTLVARLQFSRRPDERPVMAGGRSMGLGVSWLDFKLGFRMLIKYPGLTLVGGLAMAFAIAVSAVTFEIVNQFFTPVLPLDEGDRIVAVVNADSERNRLSAPFLADYVAWREQVQTIRELGAFRDISRNLILPGGTSEPTKLAQISAAGFRVPRVAPLLGRTLIDADEEVGAPLVVVISYDLWQTRFAGDSEVIGKTVGVGREVSTVVGVMPDGFGFPLSHGAWVPLQRSPVGLEPGQGSQVFGANNVCSIGYVPMYKLLKTSKVVRPQTSVSDILPSDP